jgi:endonuclease/exonuclease/phosphatase family metal-dependent hydrolase
VAIRILTWNLFHGRDFPPDPDLLTWRSRLLRISERNESHVQVNRDLRAEFAAVLAAAEWDAALLQECPPRFARHLADACAAEAHRVLTSRNSLGRLRAAAARVNPDLIASVEGGSNLTLVRESGPLGGIAERRGIEIHAGRPERRAMALTRTGSGIVLANLHASAHDPALASADVLGAAAAAAELAGPAPLVFGGDLNLRPAESPETFARLERRFGLRGTTAPRAIDHILSRGLERSGPVRVWRGEAREVDGGRGRAIRLSDHAPVEAVLA